MSDFQYVPVIDKNNKPLMPCHPARARELLKKEKAVRRWIKGVFAIKLTKRENGSIQEICLGIDPGSRKEGFTVKSMKHTFLNVQTDAITHVKKVMEKRRNARKGRRSRNTPNRKNNNNNKKGGIAPSTKARWGFKLSITNWFQKLYPISHIVVEDIQAITKPGKGKWNKSFSPIQIGKKWFYEKIKLLGINFSTITGFETKALRDSHQLIKSKNKMLEDFSAHCVDSWVMANSIVGGHSKPDNTNVLYISPLNYHRRQLHVFQPAKNNFRREYGGTRSMGFKRGSLVKHTKHGLTIVGGSFRKCISLCHPNTKRILTVRAKAKDLLFLTYLRFFIK